MKLLTKICRILTGLLFIFSGFVKGVDPMGTAYKLTDYLSAFGIGSFDVLSLPLSILLCTAEFITGMMLISGSCIKTASWLAALFMLVFTPLTLFLALYNPVSDCGCFGDAIHLTNWQTFGKNIIISVLVIIIFIKRNDKSGCVSKPAGMFSTTIFVILFILFIISNIVYLPLLDFRAYKTGTNIREAMKIPPDAPEDKYDIRFIYEKNGEQKLFTLNDYPANDTTWKFVDQKSVLISKGYVPPIHDFSLTTLEGLDITQQVILFPGYTLLMVTRRVEKAGAMNLVKGFRTAAAARKNSILFYSLTASTKDNAMTIAAEYPVLLCDETTLKTIIRANPGFVLLHDGTVTAMWTVASQPLPEEFSNPAQLVSEIHRKKTNRLIITFIVLGVLIVSAFCLPYWTKEPETLC
jgi:uncharacterized membrane protein YphA (DoxX/SURF4 family)